MKTFRNNEGFAEIVQFSYNIWNKRNYSGSSVCKGQWQSRFYWSCLSMVMKDAKPMTHLCAWAKLTFFFVKQQTINDHRGRVQCNYVFLNTATLLVKSGVRVCFTINCMCCLMVSTVYYNAKTLGIWIWHHINIYIVE